MLMSKNVNNDVSKGSPIAVLIEACSAMSHISKLIRQGIKIKRNLTKHIANA